MRSPNINLKLSLAMAGLVTVCLLPQCLSDEAATESKSTEDAPKESVDPKQIEQWIAELNDKKLSTRMKAREELVKAGEAAIPQLVVAAGSDNADTRDKSVSLLGVLLASKEKDTKDAALAALQLLADSQLPTVADLAKRALTSSGIPGVAPEPQMANTFSRKSVSVVNGARTITAENNERRVQIRDQNGQNIEIEITEGDKTRKVKARTVEELKKADEQAHDLYKELAAGGGQNILNLNVLRFGGNGDARANLSFSSNIQFGNNGNLPGIGNLPPNFAPVDQMEIMINHLEELKKRFPDNAQFNALIDQQIEQLKK